MKNFNSPTLNKFISTSKLMNYQLPGNNNSLYVVGISGGSDSAALSILLCALFPETQFHFVFTDTGNEAVGTEQLLDGFEKLTDNKITRLAHKDGLFGLIKGFNG